jgi:hypothetical protein
MKGLKQSGVRWMGEIDRGAQGFFGERLLGGVY